MSGGGVGGITGPSGEIRTPPTSPTNAVPSTDRRRGGRRARACMRPRTRRLRASDVRRRAGLCMRSSGTARNSPQSRSMSSPYRRARAVDQPRRVDHVAGAALMHVDLKVRATPHERSARAGVIEMNVGQQQRTRSLIAERRQQRRQAGRRPRIDEHVADLPAADHALAPQVQTVDQSHVIPARSQSRPQRRLERCRESVGRGLRERQQLTSESLASLMIRSRSARMASASRSSSRTRVGCWMTSAAS